MSLTIERGFDAPIARIVIFKKKLPYANVDIRKIFRQVTQTAMSVTIILLFAGLVLLFFFVFKLMHRFLFWIALIITVLGVWYWFHGGRERLASSANSGSEQLLSVSANLAADERQLLEDALKNPRNLLDEQKVRLSVIIDRMASSPMVSSNSTLVEALTRLREKINGQQ